MIVVPSSSSEFLALHPSNGLTDTSWICQDADVFLVNSLYKVKPFKRS